MASAALSKNDAAILGALFDPEASLENSGNIDLTKSFAMYEPHSQQAIEQRERDALLSINIENPSASELEAAISELSSIIKAYPRYASAYNNRAQARRMLVGDTQTLQDKLALDQILSDLDQAIKLASPLTPADSVSPSQTQILASAHTHRGLLLWRASRDETLSSDKAPFPNLDKDQLEELASRDFAVGGRYGNRSAQTLAVKTNPYAKLCGSIVREALRKEVEEYYASVGVSN